jgi:hypothetical protein
MPSDILRFDVFGRLVAIRRTDEQWVAYHQGPDGKLQRAFEIIIPPALEEDALPQHLADLCHEWASPEKQEVQRLDKNRSKE